MGAPARKRWQGARGPRHHNLEKYVDKYIAAAGIADDPDGPLFRTAAGKTGPRPARDVAADAYLDDSAPRRSRRHRYVLAITLSARPASPPTSTTTARLRPRGLPITSRFGRRSFMTGGAMRFRSTRWRRFRFKLTRRTFVNVRADSDHDPWTRLTKDFSPNDIRAERWRLLAVWLNKVNYNDSIARPQHTRELRQFQKRRPDHKSLRRVSDRVPKTLQGFVSPGTCPLKAGASEAAGL